MLKHKSSIVSRLFDTINKIDTSICDTSICDTSICDTSICDTSICDTNICDTSICDTNISNAKEEKNDEPIADNIYNANYIVSIPAHKPSMHNSKPTLICVYQVRTDALYPFLLFLLHNRNEANFIEIPLINGGYQKIKYSAISYTKTILPDTKISYSGFYELADKNIIILNCVEQPMEIYTSTEYIWTTSFEIINKRKVLNNSIHPNVLEFFCDNLSFLTLKTSDQRIYESPMVGYCKPRNDNEIDIEALDIYRETLLPSLGKCYYLFTDIPSLKEKHIMRIVFFAGKMELYGDDSKKEYESLLCNIHRRYMIQNYNQHIVLSVLGI